MLYFAVGLGGALGSCLRFIITHLCNSYRADFPYGTLLSNVVAGLLVGLVLGLDRESGLFSAHTRLFLTTGLMGGLSTFSAFSLETVDFLRHGRYLLSSLNVALNLGLGLMSVALGLVLAQAMLKRAL